VKNLVRESSGPLESEPSSGLFAGAGRSLGRFPSSSEISFPLKNRVGASPRSERLSDVAKSVLVESNEKPERVDPAL